MLKINQEKCKKCQICAKNCPIGAIAVEPGADGKKVVSITNMCVECNVCRRVCPFGAIDGAENYFIAQRFHPRNICSPGL